MLSALIIQLGIFFWISNANWVFLEAVGPPIRIARGYKVLL